jgi:predicted S18 family serine protease
MKLPGPVLALIALLLVALSCAASCSGSISQYVPAVVGTGGGLVNVTMSLVSGSGEVFAGIDPRTDVSTQDSIAQAIGYAQGLSGADTCDILVGFSTVEPTDYLEGPSAGAAMATMAYALLENRTMRTDAIMTGTIGPDGEIGAVGGVYEKAQGVARNGTSYFITPAENFYEALLLEKVEKEYGLQVLQADNVSQVIGFMLDNISIPQAGFGPQLQPLPNISAYESTGLGGFVPVAQSTMGMERSLIGSLTATDNETLEMKAYYQNELQVQAKLLQAKLLQDGYYFAAANDAFLDYIDLASIEDLTGGSTSLVQEKGKALTCLSQISQPDMDSGNFQWVIGSDQREEWAYEELNQTGIDGPMISDDEFAAYSNLSYSEAWCDVSGELAAAATAGGTPVDQSAWKEMAQEKLLEARSQPAGSDEMGFKLDTAENEYRDGMYGAAIYDAVYVAVMDNTTAEAGMNVTSAVEGLLGESRTSLWGRIYQSQGAFLHAGGDDQDAYSILEYAEALDASTDGMEAALAGTDDGQAQPPNSAANSSPLSGTAGLALIAGLILILLLLIVVIVKRGNNSQGTRTAYGAKQKKGGA